jgi:hypothetical protein
MPGMARWREPWTDGPGEARAEGAGVTGRPSKFTQQLADEICERIATTARGIDFLCESDAKLPSARTVHRWLNEHDGFRQSYLRARERQADLLFDECLEIADDVSNDTKIVGGEDYEREVANTEWISRSKLRVDTRMRMAGKLAPKKYGERLDLEHGGGLTINIKRFGE